MFMDERRINVLNFLDKHNSATVKHLAQYFSVTKETIRSDLRMLAQQGYIQRCHGGAIIIRKSLQSKLIPETDNDFEVLLKNIKQRKYEKGSVDNMKNKVCILGSFNVDIVAKVARFPKGGESLMALGSLGRAGRAQTRRRQQAVPGRKCILFLK